MENKVRFINTIYDITVDEWNSLLTTDNPFLRYEFLAALEDGECINSPKNSILNTGWVPHYAILEDANNTLLAIAPVFLKLHSYGEYVFDWSWAEAYERHGFNYFPKLIWAIPFTPSTGPRIISRCHAEQQTKYHQQIADGLTQFCLNNEFSSWHCLFPNAFANRALNSSAITLERSSCQFHWFNNNFRDFDHFLDQFTSRKRKNIKKERAKLGDSGFRFVKKTANQITAQDIETFYHCYQLTYAKRRSRGYLSLAFFKQLLRTMPDQLLLVQALITDHSSDNDKIERIVASALYFKDNDNLYGRYWGCLEEYDGLHFECCYYQGIEYCIDNNLSHFDPGTQGEHKISRGFGPTICRSQHWIAHPQFKQAISDFINEEKEHIKDYSAHVALRVPFKKQ